MSITYTFDPISGFSQWMNIDHTRTAIFQDPQAVDIVVTAELVTDGTIGTVGGALTAANILSWNWTATGTGISFGASSDDADAWALPECLTAGSSTALVVTGRGAFTTLDLAATGSDNIRNGLGFFQLGPFAGCCTTTPDPDYDPYGPPTLCGPFLPSPRSVFATLVRYDLTKPPGDQRILAAYSPAIAGAPMTPCGYNPEFVPL
jgi:hypothetical protein